MTRSITKIGRDLLLGAAALALVGCAAPHKMTKTEREALLKTCKVQQPTGSKIERNLCLPDMEHRRLGRDAPYFTAARRPISDFDEP